MVHGYSRVALALLQQVASNVRTAHPPEAAVLIQSLVLVSVLVLVLMPLLRELALLLFLQSRAAMQFLLSVKLMLKVKLIFMPNRLFCPYVSCTIAYVCVCVSRGGWTWVPAPFCQLGQACRSSWVLQYYRQSPRAVHSHAYNK